MGMIVCIALFLMAFIVYLAALGDQKQRRLNQDTEKQKPIKQKMGSNRTF
jgi:hypothetical protein